MPNYTLTAAKGTFTRTGVAASLLVARRVVAGAGSFARTGYSIGRHTLVASPGLFTRTGNAVGLYISTQDELVFKDDVAEISYTTGTTRPYVLAGPVRNKRTFASAFAEGDQTYVRIYDGRHFSWEKVRFVGPRYLVPIEVDSSSNDDDTVTWRSTGFRVIETVPAAAAVVRLLRAVAALAAYRYVLTTTGSTITLAEGERILQIDAGAASLATLTVKLPPNASHLDTCKIATTKTIDTLTVAVADGSGSSGGGSYRLAKSGSVTYRYHKWFNTWFRE